MDRDQAGELEGQTSINELLDEPIGASHVQLVLPIHAHLQAATSAVRPDAASGTLSGRLKK